METESRIEALLELAKEEYKEITPVQPKQPIEWGAGKTYEQSRAKRIKQSEAFVSHVSKELEELEAMVDAEWEELDPDV